MTCSGSQPLNPSTTARCGRAVAPSACSDKGVMDLPQETAAPSRRCVRHWSDVQPWFRRPAEDIGQRFKSPHGHGLQLKSLGPVVWPVTGGSKGATYPIPGSEQDGSGETL